MPITDPLLTGFSLWHWLTLGGVLAILELFVPGVFLIWIGIAAFLVGALMAVFPGISWEFQVLFFALLSLATTALQWIWMQRNPIVSDQPYLNRRGHQYIGRVFSLDAPIVNGFGKIKVDDSTWKVRGPDTELGTKVIVTGVDGTVLLVEPQQDSLTKQQV
ncbi:hypothetical protein TI04_05995 [Achromatium sp. WMS2]|nr:hypothetical protein TI04_05995 [Achromatium sp. WMS2]